MTANAKSATTIYQVFRHQVYTLTSGQTVWQGDGCGLVASTGKVVKWASGRTDLTFVGVFEEDYVATADMNCRVDRLRNVNAIKMANDTGTALALAGATAYMLDSATATGSSTTNSVAGPVVQVDSDGVWIELVSAVGTSLTVAALVKNDSLPGWTSNDWAPTVAQLSSGSVYVVPTTGAASTITLPTAGSPVEGTVIYFVADGTKNGHTVTYRVGATALTTALTASKRHQVTAIFAGGVWTVNAYVNAN